MAFTWQKPLGKGVIIYLDTILEVRQNVDHVDDTKCSPHNTTVRTGYDSTVYRPENSTYKGAEYYWNMADHDRNVLVGDDGTIYSDDKTLDHHGYDSIVDSGDYGTHCSVDNATVNSPYDAGVLSTNRDPYNSDYDDGVLTVFA